MKKVLIVIAALFLMHCGSGPTGTEPPSNNTMTLEELLDAGWQAFAGDRYVTAKQYFDQALIKESANSSANLGKGWSLLLEGSSHYQIALNAFDQAIQDVNCEADCRAGIISTKFVQQKYDEIPSLISIMLSKYPKYSFSHKSDINWQDLLLMKAQAFYFNRQYLQAWTTVKQLTSEYNYIDPEASETWIVEEQTFFSFEAVLSRIIHILSNTFK